MPDKRIRLYEFLQKVGIAWRQRAALKCGVSQEKGLNSPVSYDKISFPVLSTCG